MNSYVPISTTLPPLVEGKVSSLLQLHIPFIAWLTHGGPEVHHYAQVNVKWWGETSEGTWFIPQDLNRALVSLNPHSTAKYEVCCGPNQFVKYLSDMGSLELVVFSHSSEPLGRAVINEISSLSLSSAVVGHYPVWTSSGLQIAELYVSITLEAKLGIDHGDQALPEVDAADFLLKEARLMKAMCTEPSNKNVLQDAVSLTPLVESMTRSFHPRLLDLVLGRETCKKLNTEEKECGDLVTKPITHLLQANIPFRASSPDNISIHSDSSISLPDESVLEKLFYIEMRKSKQELASMDILDHIHHKQKIVEANKSNTDTKVHREITSSENSNLKPELPVIDPELLRRLRQARLLKVTVVSFKFNDFHAVKESLQTPVEKGKPDHWSYIVELNPGSVDGRESWDYSGHKAKTKDPVKFFSRKETPDGVVFNQEAIIPWKVTSWKVSDLLNNELLFNMNVRIYDRRKTILLGHSKIKVRDIAVAKFSSEISLPVLNIGSGKHTKKHHLPPQLGFLKVCLSIVSTQREGPSRVPNLVTESSCINTLVSKPSDDSKHKGTCLTQSSCDIPESQITVSGIHTMRNRPMNSVSTQDVALQPQQIQDFGEPLEVTTQGAFAKTIPLHCFLKVSRGKSLIQRDGGVDRNPYLATHLLFDEDAFHSDVKWKTSNPEFHYSQISPLLLTTALLERTRNKVLVIELWDKTGHENDELIGLVKLPLHTFFLSLKSPVLRSAVLQSQYPIVAVDGWVPVINPVSGQECGDLLVLLALGTWKQITSIIGVRSSNLYMGIQMSDLGEPVNDPPCGLEKFFPKEISYGGQEKPYYGFEVTISKVENLHLGDTMVWGEADCIVSYLFPQFMSMASENQGTPVLEMYKTDPVLCMPDVVLSYNRLHHLPANSCVEDIFKAAILRSVRKTGKYQNVLPVDVWCRFYYPALLDKLVAKADLPIGVLCALAAKSQSSKVPVSQQLSLPLKQPHFQQSLDNAELNMGYVSMTVKCWTVGGRHMQSGIDATAATFLEDRSIQTDSSPNEKQIIKWSIYGRQTDKEVQTSNHTTVPRKEMFVDETPVSVSENLSVCGPFKKISGGEGDNSDIGFLSEGYYTGSAESNEEFDSNKSQSLLSSPAKSHSSVSGSRVHFHSSSDQHKVISFKVHLSVHQTRHLMDTWKKKSHEDRDLSLYISVQHNTLLQRPLITNIAPAQANLSWDWHQETMLTLDPFDQGNMTLVFKVWVAAEGKSHLQDMTKDKMLGFASVNLRPLLYGLPYISGWYHVVNLSGEEQGQIKVSITPLEKIPNLVKGQRSMPQEVPNFDSAQVQTSPEMSTDSEVLHSSLRQQLLELDSMCERLENQQGGSIKNDPHKVSSCKDHWTGPVESTKSLVSDMLSEKVDFPHFPEHDNLRFLSTTLPPGISQSIEATVQKLSPVSIVAPSLLWPWTKVHYAQKLYNPIEKSFTLLNSNNTPCTKDGAYVFDSAKQIKYVKCTTTTSLGNKGKFNSNKISHYKSYMVNCESFRSATTHSGRKCLSVGSYHTNAEWCENHEYTSLSDHIGNTLVTCISAGDPTKVTNIFDSYPSALSFPVSAGQAGATVLMSECRLTDVPEGFSAVENHMKSLFRTSNYTFETGDFSLDELLMGTVNILDLVTTDEDCDGYTDDSDVSQP